MNSRRLSWLTRCFGIAAFLLAAGVLYPCSIPVFRYALERWEADPYEAAVFHRGPLAEEDQAIIDSLRKRALIGEHPANLRIRAFDLDKPLPKGAERIWQEQKNPQPPWMVVLFPMMAESREIVWSGRFSREAVEMLTDSPRRRELARRILAGESAVWLFLESGNRTKDDDAAATLTRELARLQKELELPPMEELTGGAEAQGTIYGALQPVTMESTLPLRLEFSTLRVSRDDPAERVLVDILMKTEPDLKEYLGEPMAFPVFGRGRALFALVGKGINPRTIEHAAFFLAGACSCEVKAYNPGTDLLMSASWDAVLQNAVSVDVALPPLTGVMPFRPKTEDTETTPSAGTTLVPSGGQKPPGNLTRNLLITALVLVGAVMVGGLVVALRQKTTSA